MARTGITFPIRSHMNSKGLIGIYYYRVFTSTLTETITNTDTFLYNIIRVLTETVTNTDTFLAVKVQSTTLSEIVTNTDTILRLTVRTLTETITNTATFLSMQTLVRTYTETVTGTDTFAQVHLYVFEFTEILAMSDQLIVRLNGIVTNLWSKVSRGSDVDSDWTKEPFN